MASVIAVIITALYYLLEYFLFFIAACRISKFACLIMLVLLFYYSFVIKVTVFETQQYRYPFLYRMKYCWRFSQLNSSPVNNGMQS